MLQYLTAEFVLTKFRRHNGGDVILFRSIWIALLVCVVGVGLYNALEVSTGERVCRISLVAAKDQLFGAAAWFAGIFGGSYAGLYARFSSQWSYLANTYNQIKSVESSGARLDQRALADWKAGFIEDADCLHLATKESIAPTIRAWAKDPAVRRAFIRNAPGGDRLLPFIMARVEVAVILIERKKRR